MSDMEPLYAIECFPEIQPVPAIVEIQAVGRMEPERGQVGVLSLVLTLNAALSAGFPGWWP